MSDLRYLLAERHKYRLCMSVYKRNPLRWPEGQTLTFRDWLDLPF